MEIEAFFPDKLRSMRFPNGPTIPPGEFHGRYILGNFGFALPLLVATFAASKFMAKPISGEIWLPITVLLILLTGKMLTRSGRRLNRLEWLLQNDLRTAIKEYRAEFRFEMLANSAIPVVLAVGLGRFRPDCWQYLAVTVPAFALGFGLRWAIYHHWLNEILDEAKVHVRRTGPPPRLPS